MMNFERVSRNKGVNWSDRIIMLSGSSRADDLEFKNIMLAAKTETDEPSLTHRYIPQINAPTAFPKIPFSPPLWPWYHPSSFKVFFLSSLLSHPSRATTARDSVLMALAPNHDKTARVRIRPSLFGSLLVVTNRHGRRHILLGSWWTLRTRIANWDFWLHHFISSRKIPSTERERRSNGENKRKNEMEEEGNNEIGRKTKTGYGLRNMTYDATITYCG